MNSDKCKARQSRLRVLTRASFVVIAIVCIYLALWGVTGYWGTVAVAEYLAQQDIAVEDDGISASAPFVIEVRELRVLMGSDPLVVYFNSFTVETNNYFWFFGYITDV